METLRIKLKQHTPLIHFQHNQEGATLRASEVKPKLDYYLLTKLGAGNYETGIRKARERNWLIGDHAALNYKMSIDATDVEIWDMNKQYAGDRKPRTISMPLFFGNMGNNKGSNDTFKKMSFSTSPINMDLVFNQEREGLVNEIKKHINSFFMLNNFGTRQSKGFGCFLLDPSDECYHLDLPKKYATFSVKPIEFGTFDCYKILFENIELFYKSIRSGINQKGVYLKSLMYFYALDIESYWDKRKIRHQFGHFTPYKTEDKGEIYEKKNDGSKGIDEARLYRDMLGLSSSQQWMTYQDTITKEHKIGTIERFKSPILFKPIYDGKKFIIYIITQKIPAEYLDTEFIISSSVRNKSFTMKTPSEFDLEDFMVYISDENIKKWVIKELKEHKKLKELKELKEFKAIKKFQSVAKPLIRIYEELKYFNNE